MENNSVIEEIIELMNKSSVEASNKYKEELFLRMSSYFDNKKAESGNIITPEIIEDAIRLYMIPGYNKFVLQALKISKAQFNKLTLRKIQDICDRCGSPVTVKEYLFSNGYGRYWHGEKHCDACKEYYREINHQETSDWCDKEYQKRKKSIQEESIIISSNDPLDERVLIDILYEYYNFWKVGIFNPYEFFNQQQQIKYFNRCMFCGNKNFEMYVNPNVELRIENILDLGISQTCRSQILECFPKYFDREKYLYPNGADEPDTDIDWPTYSRIVSILQVIMRTEPHSYFMNYPQLPFFKMPILMACDKCAIHLNKEYNKIDFCEKHGI